MFIHVSCARVYAQARANLSYHFALSTTWPPGMRAPTHLKTLGEINTTLRKLTVSAPNSTQLADNDLTIFEALDRTLRKLEPARVDASNRPPCLEGTNTIQSIID
jgi:hypothetical protein